MEPHGSEETSDIEGAEICCGFISNELHSSDKRQYFEPVLGHVEVTSLIIIRGLRLSSLGGVVRGVGRPVIYTTTLVRKQDIGYDLESVPFIYHDRNAISQCQFWFYIPLSSK